MQEIQCIIWSEDADGRVMGHLSVHIPLEKWSPLTDWCWDDGRREQFRWIVILGTCDPPIALDAKGVRELHKEVLALPPQVIAPVSDLLIPFLEKAIQVVDLYANTPYRVTIDFRPGKFTRRAVWYWPN